ncbi:hypothetical protein PV327_009245 [Microctonus hyperodae]|uniref:Uncharacterized protein n=1 Tax=Microctonus hyperodae TaxID=165561 RepID=A0AA39FTR9_MICHY|nr:hypothetical protein PV327_009245 [Microctonus hyperodae]
MDKPHHQWMDDENTSEVPGTSEAFDEIPWPIGVPWVPQEFDKNKKPKNKQEKSKLAEQKTPSPRNEKEMKEVIKRMKHQAIIYRSLYKHWTDITYQAHQQVIKEKLPITRAFDHSPANEKIPYFFYLYNPPDVDTAIRRDDRAILLGNEKNGKISTGNSSQGFNSTDKT